MRTIDLSYESLLDQTPWPPWPGSWARGARRILLVAVIAHLSGSSVSPVAAKEDGGGLLNPNDVIQAGTSGSDGPASATPDGFPVAQLIDGNNQTDYRNLGKEGSAFIVTLSGGPAVVTGFRMTTGSAPRSADPVRWQLFGANAPTEIENYSDDDEVWQLIGDGSVQLPSERAAAGPVVELANSTAYSSYRMVFVELVNSAEADFVQLAEIQFYGSPVKATWTDWLKKRLRTTLGPPLKKVHEPVDRWLGSLPMSVAVACALGLYAGAVVWVWTLRREFVFRGAPDKRWYRDLRLWATVVVMPYVAIYILLGR